MRSQYDGKTRAFRVGMTRIGPDAGPWIDEHVVRVSLEELREAVKSARKRGPS